MRFATYFVLFLAAFIYVFYYVALSENEATALGDLVLESKSVSLDESGRIEVVLLNNAGKQILVTGVSGDCSVIPPMFSIKVNGKFSLTCECDRRLVESDGTADLVVQYKVKEGPPKDIKQAIKVKVD